MRLFFTFVVTLIFVLDCRADSGWKAAVFTKNITPEEPMWMGGYAARKGPSEGVLQPLFMKMVVVEDSEGHRAVIVTADLIGIPKPFRVVLEELARTKHAIKPGELLLNASHTHSGPMIRAYQPPGGGAKKPSYSAIPEDQHEMRVEQTEKYQERLEKSFVDLLDKCMSSLQPVTVSYSKARCGFAMNRRTPAGPGVWKNSPNPDAPVDHDVPVLQIKGVEEGDLLAVLFGYSCHATVLSGMELNGDWPGYAQQYFEEDHPGAVALFLNGCSGDQNPYPRRLLRYVERHGRSMATAIEAALQSPATPIEGRLSSAIAWEEIEYQQPPSRKELEEKAKSSDRYDARYAQFLLDVLDSGESFPTSYPVPVQVIRFGKALTLATMGGEVVVDYSLRLKRELGALTGASVWVAGYSNDVMTYIPSKRVLEEGGYEGGGAMRYVRSTIHPAQWEPAIEDKLIRRIHSLTEQLLEGESAAR
ncbi:MAG: neutral/alkaline non-lysosomal ceramidase N-terminal domain-containing protein [Verrucomicrobiales bacterium]|nr:neutral/alkaline non-lysosomal ceramidase N-terminal domain-containing protein [Verrucomicrobiales bacterium]